MTPDPKGMEAARKAAANEAREYGLPEPIDAISDAAITAYIAASQEPAPVAIPTGWYLVPEVPTEDQMRAGLYQSSHDAEYADVCQSYMDMVRTPIDAPTLYAAPVPPVVGEDAFEASAKVKIPDGMTAASATKIMREHALELQGKLDHAAGALSPPMSVGEDAARLTDTELTARLRTLTMDVFPSANQWAISDGVRRIISILERVTPEEYALLHRSMYPPRADRSDDDGQPTEMQEWQDYDPDC